MGTEILGMLGRENFGCWFCLGEKRQLRMTLRFTDVKTGWMVLGGGVVV